MLRNSLLNTDTSEAELFQLIKKGNKQAFTVIYEKYHKMLYILAHRYLKDSGKAEDAVQHIFIKLWEFHSEISVSINLKNYLFTMTRNYILNQIRNERSAMEHNYKIVQENGEYEDDLLDNIERKEQCNSLYEAINQLPEQKKLVCLYKMEEKLSNEEIAEKMDISIHTVKSHYSQSLKILKSHFEKMLIFICIFILL